ncbi:DUF2948 family protein [Actibacterium ureilyticum]|uniref:DUF2948 family protein n=1 Tax=Actibacterium ureilyticum TaxID=1590614 RepID=UPI000BAACD3B|nr:DUF2948 family protein [Actibacterium ureilyticum]
MSEDARFEDAGDRPLYLGAVTPEDLQVISSLVQDAVFPVTEISWRGAERRFSILLNRFRWEDADAATQRGRPYERVQAVLSFGDVLKTRAQGVDRSDADMILSLLSVDFEPGADGAGRVLLTLAGDGLIALEVECLNATLRDVTRPYVAPSRHQPKHDG